MSNVKIELEIPEDILINLKQSTEEFKNELKIELEIPEDILINLKQSTEEFKNELKLVMAIELYKKKRLSLGKAAVLCGFTKLGFIDVLHFRGEPVFNYTDDEIEAEIQNIKKLTINGDFDSESNM